MGFMSNSCGFTRLKLTDPVPDELWAGIQDSLVKGAFIDIDNSTEMTSTGWANFDSYLDTGWLLSPPEKGAYITFTLRHDVRRIPTSVIRKQLELRVDQERERIKAEGKVRVSAARKRELKEEVLFKICRGFLPTPGQYGVVWNRQNGEIWLAATQAKLVDLFKEYFFNTFGLHLLERTPSLMAEDVLGEDQAEKIGELKATIFTGDTVDAPASDDVDKVLGQEFLTWVWYLSDVAPAGFRDAQGNGFDVGVEKRICVEGGTGDEKETTTMVVKSSSAMNDARFGLAQGKKVERAVLSLGKEDLEFKIGLKAETLSPSLKTPKIDKSDMDDDPDALFYEKVSLVESALELFDSLYGRFVKLRFNDEEWIKEAEDMRSWMSKKE